MVNHYGTIISQLQTFNETKFEKLYTYALKYAQTDENVPSHKVFFKIDTKSDFIILTKRIYDQLKTSFDSCS
jgi:hypothetical protein